MIANQVADTQRNYFHASKCPKFVLYHGNCPDGFTAAWAAWKAMGDDAKYIPVTYGHPVPKEVVMSPPGIVYILDFSYPRDILVGLHADHVIRVLDHHQTAQADLEGLSFCTFDMNRSGATLAWDYFHPRTDVPRIVQYAEDRDLWRFKLPYSKEVSAWIMSFEYSFERWDDLEERLHTDFHDVVNEGGAILRSKGQMVLTMAKQARIIKIGGYDVPVANATVAFSEVANVLCQLYPEHAFAAYYYDRKDGTRHWGLRSVGEFDVSAIAQKYGGGGHKNAAGFTTTTNPFIGALVTSA